MASDLPGDGYQAGIGSSRMASTRTGTCSDPGWSPTLVILLSSLASREG